MPGDWRGGAGTLNRSHEDLGGSTVYCNAQEDNTQIQTVGKYTLTSCIDVITQTSSYTHSIQVTVYTHTEQQEAYNGEYEWQEPQEQ